MDPFLPDEECEHLSLELGWTGEEQREDSHGDADMFAPHHFLHEALPSDGVSQHLSVDGAAGVSPTASSTPKHGQLELCEGRLGFPSVGHSVTDFEAHATSSSVDVGHVKHEDPSHTTNAAGKRKATEHETGSMAGDSDRDSPTNSRTKKQRGMFARLTPQIQENARQAQRHWGEKVQEVRDVWTRRSTWQHHAHFSTQIAMCTRLHIKSQHECILRQLQMAVVDGQVTPSAFTDDDTRSFLGWTGFEVVSQHAAEFRRRIEGMFAAPPNDKTLNNTMRRAGLIAAQSWDAAWEGKGYFVYDATKRAQYGRE